MADRVLRGSRLGAVSYETDRDHDLAPRRIVQYRTDNGEIFDVPFADDAEVPSKWPCKNGMEGTILEGAEPEEKKVKPPRARTGTCCSSAAAKRSSKCCSMSGSTFSSSVVAESPTDVRVLNQTSAGWSHMTPPG